MPTIEIAVPPPQLPQSVCPVVMKILDARPDVHRFPAADTACDCCGSVMPADGSVRFEHHANDLTSCFVCSACEAAYQAWKAGEYCHDCGTLLKDDEKQYDADDIPLCAACADKWTHCDDCGKHIPKAETETTADGDTICGDCSIAEYTTCGHCDELVNNSDIVGRYDHAPLCQSCYEDEFFTCDGCGDMFRNDDAHSINDDWLCESCYDARVTTCSDCGCVIENPDDSYTVRDNTICEDCMHDHYHRCDECGEILQEQYAYFDDDSCFCEYCYNARNAHIKRYSYKPPWEYQHLPAEAGRNVLYMGVELEVDNTDGEHNNDDVAEVMCDMLPAICKEDGSIKNGFEIVTHPMTFAYARSREGIFKDALAYLRSHGFSGHNHGGMHIHMSKAAFSDLHVIKFSRLFMDNVHFWTRLSQRKQANLDRWANFDSSPRFDREAVKGGKRHRNAYRYAALNFTSQTIEVRIFNSSIRTDRFYKNLEACQAAFDFSKAYGLLDMTAEKFAAFIVSRRSLYPNLAAFLVEKSMYLTARAGEPQMIVKQLFSRATRLRAASGM